MSCLMTLACVWLVEMRTWKHNATIVAKRLSFGVVILVIFQSVIFIDNVLNLAERGSFRFRYNVLLYSYLIYVDNNQSRTYI